jgi:hypothetical protein
MIVDTAISNQYRRKNSLMTGGLHMMITSTRHCRRCIIFLFVCFLAAVVTQLESTAFAEEETSKVIAYFCGKRGDLSAPQCAVLLNELRGRGDEGHVLVCNQGEKVWACRTGRCDEISGIVGIIHHKLSINDHLRLCDLVCGTCKTGWK